MTTKGNKKGHGRGTFQPSSSLIPMAESSQLRMSGSGETIASDQIFEPLRRHKLNLPAETEKKLLQNKRNNARTQLTDVNRKATFAMRLQVTKISNHTFNSVISEAFYVMIKYKQVEADIREFETKNKESFSTTTTKSEYDEALTILAKKVDILQKRWAASLTTTEMSEAQSALPDTTQDNLYPQAEAGDIDTDEVEERVSEQERERYHLFPSGEAGEVAMGSLSRYPPTPHHRQRQGASSLPPINERWAKTITEFSGKPSEFEMWWGHFAKVIDNTSSSDFEKSMYLHKAIAKGSAAAIVGANCEYEEAKERLLSHYRNFTEVQRLSQKVLANLPIARSGDVETLATNVNKIQNMLTTLVRSKAPTHYLLTNFVSGAFSKLPDTWYREWAKLNAPVPIKDDLPTKLKELFQAMMAEEQYIASNAALRELYEPTSSNGTNNYENNNLTWYEDSSDDNYEGDSAQEVQRESLRFDTYSERQRRGNICIFCDEAHVSFRCDKRMSAKERIEIAKDKQKCFVCFQDHKVRDCRSRYTCRRCGKKHSLLVCPKPQNYKKQIQEDENMSEQDEESDEYPRLSTLYHITSEGMKLGPKMRTPPVEVPIRFREIKSNEKICIQLDTGADDSILNLNFVRKLKIKTTPTTQYFKTISYVGKFVGKVSLVTKIGKIEKRVTFLIPDDKAIPSFLGRNDILQFRLRIDDQLKVSQEAITDEHSSHHFANTILEDNRQIDEPNERKLNPFFTEPHPVVRFCPKRPGQQKLPEKHRMVVMNTEPFGTEIGNELYDADKYLWLAKAASVTSIWAPENQQQFDLNTREGDPVSSQYF